MTTFGKLQQVDLRTGWSHEAFDFTKWLVQPENLQLLSDEIGIEVAPIETEARTGKYSVDILAEEENTGNKIIIENQLEKTDHDHLGKIITYASGYDAEYILWIVKDANEEHRQAMEWLNENTNTSLNFFLIRLELWQIDNSDPAVKMNIIVKPNEWTKVLRERQTNDELTETKELQLKFWTRFKNYCDEQNATFISRKPRASRAYDIAIGTSKAHIRLTASTMYSEVRIMLVIKQNKELFERYYEEKENIEEKIGAKLKWEGAPDQKRSLIKLVRDADIENEDEWAEYHKWLLENARTFKEVFGS